MALTLVRYKGVSDTRVINPSDLKPHGVDIDKPLKWERKNLWKVYIDGMSEELEAVFREDGAFTVEEVDAETGKKVQTIVTAKPGIDDTGNTVVDATTGQKSSKK